MKKQTWFYLNVFAVFMIFLFIQIFSFAQIESIPLASVDYTSLWILPYTLLLITMVIVFLYYLPTIIIIETTILFIALKKRVQLVSYDEISFKKQLSYKMIKNLTRELNVILC